MIFKNLATRFKSWVKSICPIPRDAFWTLLIFSTAVVVWQLWATAHDPRWLGHLRIDPIVYHARALAFLDDHSWVGTGMNEYQPGALWFFVLVAAALADPGPFDAFLRALFVANCLILCLHVWLAAVFGGKRSPWILLLLAAATGPILLFRFELLVSLLVLSGWLLWRARHLNSCAFLLGAAMATKIYPVLLAPLLAYDAWRTGGWKKTASVGLAGTLGLASVALSLSVFGAQGGDLASAVKFHFDKPYGIDGFPGSLIPLVQDWLEIPLRMAPRNGIHGFESDLGVASDTLLNWIWLPIAIVVLILLARNRNRPGFPEAGALFALFGIYVGLGKLMAPQYTWWALPFLPFASAGWFGRKTLWTILILLVACQITGQVVYPLNYSEFITSFSSNPTTNRLFWINAVKNLVWLSAISFALVSLINRKSAFD
jgi:hypothetical protein